MKNAVRIIAVAFLLSVCCVNTVSAFSIGPTATTCTNCGGTQPPK
jgi:hypothetical protein